MPKKDPNYAREKEKYSTPIASREFILDAIKQALVDLSLGSELRLATSAYVDERGVLHESSLVTSQAQIRGVRVLAYLQEAGMTTASLEAAMATSECAVKRPGLKRQVLVSVDHGLLVKHNLSFYKLIDTLFFIIELFTKIKTE